METLQPQQLAQEAQAAYQKQDYLTAARLFQAAAEGYLAAGDRLEHAEMANNCSVAHFKAGDAQSALDAAQGTEQVFASAGKTRQQAMALGNQAAALDKLKRLDEAISAYIQSADLLKVAGDDELRAYTMQSLSMLQLRKRKYLEAYATMRAGVMGIKKPNLRQRLLKTLIQIPYNLMK